MQNATVQLLNWHERESRASEKRVRERERERERGELMVALF